jgi:hypothetical protein
MGTDDWTKYLPVLPCTFLIVNSIDNKTEGVIQVSNTCIYYSNFNQLTRLHVDMEESEYLVLTSTAPRLKISLKKDEIKILEELNAKEGIFKLKSIREILQEKFQRT